MGKEDLMSKIEEFLVFIKDFIETKLSKKEIIPNEETYSKWKVNKFEYTEKGIGDFSSSGKLFTKLSWYSAATIIETAVKESKEYKDILIELNKLFDKENYGQFLDSLIRKFTLYYLDNRENFDENSIKNKFSTPFVKDLNKEPLKCWAEIEIDGLALIPENIEATPTIKIRKVKKEDLEKEVPFHPFLQSDWHTKPSAIMKLECELVYDEPGKLQKAIEKAIAILRLFKVGSICYIAYDLNSESISGFISGRLSGNRGFLNIETATILGEEVELLKDFFRVMDANLPPSFFEIGQPRIDYTAIAYDHYCDALLEKGVMERKIANVVMGLEALFLNENLELGYRLKMRIAKFFALLGYDPYKIKEIIKDAYYIRSVFAHGGTLSYKDKKKYESKYGSLKDFLIKILDHLRIALVLTVLMNKQKEEFVDLLDDSFIDSSKDVILKNQISDWKKILILNGI